MFGFVNVGERAGSGVDKIMTAWAEQNWKKPEFDFSERSDRVTLKLEVGQKEADKVLTEIEAIVGTTDSDIVAYFTTCTGEENFPREVYFEVTRI